MLRAFLAQQVSPLVILPLPRRFPSGLISASGSPRWSQW
ncbi:rhs core with extension domain protein [Escherichia coli EPECa12]|nr:rhs core with extension domain protein [Escherichia coli EPECa12]